MFNVIKNVGLWALLLLCTPSSTLALVEGLPRGLVAQLGTARDGKDAAPQDASVEPVTPLSEGAQTVKMFGRRVSRLQIQAPERLQASARTRAAHISPGRRLQRLALRRVVTRLFLLHRVADVQVWAQADGDDVALRVVLIPALVLRTIAVQGAIGISPQEILTQLGLAEGDVIDGLDRAAISAALLQYYADKGYQAAQVDLRLKSLDDDGGSILHVDIVEGAWTQVRALLLSADSADARLDLKDWSALGRGQRFDRAALRKNLHALWQKDLARGFLRAQPITMQSWSLSNNRVDVKLRYDRGARYQIRFQGATVRSPATLRELIKPERLEPLDQDYLISVEERLTRAYRRWAYPNAKVKVHDQPGDTGEQRLLVVDIKEGPRVVLQGVRIDGAEGTLAQDLSDLASQTVSDGFVEQSAFNPVEPGDLASLLQRRMPGADPLPGVEYPMAALDIIAPRKVYDPQAYRAAGPVLEDYCRSQGYLTATVAGPRAKWLSGQRRVEAYYQVLLGTQTFIGTLRFSGNQAFLAADLLARSKVEPGQALDLSRLEQARLALLETYADAGYAYAAVQTTYDLSADRRLATVHFVIDEGPQVRITRILLRGQQRTHAAVLLDRMLLREGDLYSASAIEKSRQRLLALGLLSTVQMTLVDAERPEANKDLRVDVSERQARVFETHLGASVEDGPRAGLLFAHRNLLGLGLGARGRLKLNYPRLTYFTISDDALREHMEQRFVLEYPGLDDSIRQMMFTEGRALFSLEYPKIFAIPVDTSAHGTLMAMRENRSAFTLNKVALQFGVDVQATKALRLGSSVELAGTDFLCYVEVGGPFRACGNDENGLTRRQDTGQLGHVTLRQEASVDGRDNPFRPHVGYRWAGVADVAFGGGLLYGDSGIGPGRVTTEVTSNFVKLSSSLSGYLPLTKTWTLALQMRAGNIFGMSDQEHIPLYKKFFLGGTSSVRGFDEDRVLPADEVQDIQNKLASGAYSDETAQRLLTGSSSGGRFFWNARSELRLPMSSSVDLGLFLDAGELSDTFDTMDISRFSAGAGAGLRWNTPVGPIALDFGLALKDPTLALRDSLNPQQGIASLEDRYKVHLSIGYF